MNVWQYLDIFTDRFVLVQSQLTPRFIRSSTLHKFVSLLDSSEKNFIHAKCATCEQRREVILHSVAQKSFINVAVLFIA